MNIIKETYQQQNPFASFWMGGYECTDKLNKFGARVDFLNITSHLDLIDEDYTALEKFKIKTIREGLRWSYVEKRPYEYDWSTVALMIEAGKRNGIQQVWDICHFGFPDDITPLHPMFTPRFVAFCTAFIRFYRTLVPVGELIVTPINEVSFLSWLGGDACGTSPYCTKQGWEVKYALMRAYIQGIAALKIEDPGVRILTTEPLVNMVPPADATDEQKLSAIQQHENQFQALDILSGRICPELEGKPEYLDLLGFNYYYNNQWITGSGNFLPWANEDNDERWLPLSTLLKNVYERYGKPMILTETSHPLEDRPLWIEFIALEANKVLAEGLPFWGICWYPIIDRPDWDYMAPYHHSGLWDTFVEDGIVEKRVLYEPAAAALLKAQEVLF